MQQQDMIGLMGFERAVAVGSEGERISGSEREVLTLAKRFNVDVVYFNTDEKGNSFPAVFLKKVTAFNPDTLQAIAETHQNIWNYKKVLFLYVYSATEIRIYNCSERPIVKTHDEINYEKELQRLEIKSATISDKKKLQELIDLFSRMAIDTGIIWTLEEAASVRKKINLQRRVDKYLVASLVKTAEELKSQGLNLEFIHKIILRSLFLLYLEDRGAAGEPFYSKIKPGAKSYFDILEDVNATYALFAKLEEHFNGNVFTIDDTEFITAQQLRLIKNCFTSGFDETLQTKLFEGWRLFNFNIISIELLSEIYENFLFKTDPELKKKTGTYYTPPSLVEFILNDKLPLNQKENDYNIKILDPACGSGIFLVQSYKRLVKRYENHHQVKLTDFNKLKELLTGNIFGIELHPQAIKVAAFSLYLALVDQLDPKTLWQDKNYRLPNLVNNPNDKTLKEQGNNLFCADTIATNKTIEAIAFDLVVGNPPFGTDIELTTIREYCTKQKFAKEMVLPFLHKAIQFAPDGEIALIFNTKVLTNTGGTYQNFRRWLFNQCYVEKVYNFSILRKVPESFGGQLFGDATGPISIVFYRKNEPLDSKDAIVYYAPKTYIKSNIIEGLTIDPTDVKHLPREECKKPDTKIWKVAMWGGMNDWKLLQNLNNKYQKIKSLFVQKDIEYGVGFELSSPAEFPNSEIKNLPIHTPKNIIKYYTPVPNKRIKSDKFRRLGNLEAYMRPHILLNEGIKVQDNNLTLLASFVNYKSAYSKGIVGIFSKNNNEDLLKVLTFYFNSEFIRYYAFITTSSWGIERDVVKHKELFEAPYLLDGLDQKKCNYLIEQFDINLKGDAFYFNNNIVENELNKYISNCFDNNTKFLIEHTLLNIDLFHKQEKSFALYPALPEQTIKYATVICNEINEFLKGQDLYVNATVFKNINRYTPLMLIKLSFNNQPNEIMQSDELVDSELRKLDKSLWDKESSNIYFRKKLNYKTDDDIYLIRPNQRRFWSQSMAVEDASELILEILNGI